MKTKKKDKQPKANISAIVLAKDEEGNIKKCLISLAFCKEILVVDDNSKDKTGLLAKKLGARVIKHALKGNYAQQKNWAMGQVKSEWVLFVDADEIVTKRLAQEIVKRLARETEFNGYLLPRRDFLFGRSLRYGEVGKAAFVRLARKSKGKWRRRVHEEWVVKGNLGTLDNHLSHFPHPTIADFVEHIDAQSTLHALANGREGKKATIIKIFFYPIGKFISGYFLKRGFLDGIAGLTLAGMMSIHSFLAWVKLWQAQRKK